MNPYGDDMIVDQVIGSAYQVVRYVAANMETLIELSDSMDTIQSVLGELQTIIDNMPALLEISGNIPDLLELHSHLSELLSIYNNLNIISDVHGSLDDIQVIADNLDTLTDNVALLNGNREALRRSYAEAGYKLIDGSFEAGGTLVNANDVLLQERTGKAFSGPAGTVAAGTNPVSGGFVDASLSSPLTTLKVSAFNPQTPADMQRLFDIGKDIDFDINFTTNIPLTFKSNVSGRGQLSAASGVALGSLVSAGANNIRWDVNLDMGQNAATLLTDNRCQVGFYVANKTGIRGKFKVFNVRYGRPVFITGTSGNSTAGDGSHDPIAGEGSTNIRIDYDCDAFTSPETDGGCYSVVRSDFYSVSDVNLHDASNARKKLDLSIDTTKAYPATTKNIWLSGNWVNHDRVAVLNAKEVFITNFYAGNFKTRGFNFSPSCEDCHVSIGKVSGNAASINFTFSKGCTAGDLSIEGTGPLGQKLSLKAVGSEDIIFHSITGRGGLNGTLEFSGSKDIVFRDIKAKKALNSPSGPELSLYAMYYDGAYAANFIANNIVIDGCRIAANQLFLAENVTATSKVAINGVKVRNSKIDNTSSLMSFAPTPDMYGMFDFEGVSWNFASASGIKPEYFGNYRNNAEPMNFMDKFVGVPTSSIFVDFPTLYFYAREGGGDNTRMPGITLWKDGVPMVYDVDWFMDGAPGSSGTYGKMTKRVRLRIASSISATYIMQRHS